MWCNLLIKDQAEASYEFYTAKGCLDPDIPKVALAWWCQKYKDRKIKFSEFEETIARDNISITLYVKYVYMSAIVTAMYVITKEGAGKHLICRVIEGSVELRPLIDV